MTTVRPPPKRRVLFESDDDDDVECDEPPPKVLAPETPDSEERPTFARPQRQTSTRATTRTDETVTESSVFGMSNVPLSASTSTASAKKKSIFFSKPARVASTMTASSSSGGSCAWEAAIGGDTMSVRSQRPPLPPVSHSRDCLPPPPPQPVRAQEQRYTADDLITLSDDDSRDAPTSASTQDDAGSSRAATPAALTRRASIRSVRIEPSTTERQAAVRMNTQHTTGACRRHDGRQATTTKADEEEKGQENGDNVTPVDVESLEAALSTGYAVKLERRRSGKAEIDEIETRDEDEETLEEPTLEPSTQSQLVAFSDVMVRSPSQISQLATQAAEGKGFKKFRKARQGRHFSERARVVAIIGGSADLVDFRQLQV